jgi:hypothetical protein
MWKDMTRDYGYVERGGSANFLICNNHPLDQYRVTEVCMEKVIDNRIGRKTVNIC